MRKPERVPVVPGNFDYARFLASLDEEQFRLLFELNDTRYDYYDKWKYLAADWGMDPRQLWAGVKTARIGQKSLAISQLPGFSFKINTPAIVQKYLHTFDLNLGGNLRGGAIMPSEDKDRYLISSLMEEAIASSQLEGAATTRKVAKEMLESNRKPRNHSEQMILNNYEAMKWIAAHKDESFTVDRIKILQTIITKNTLHGEAAGAFRTTDDFNVVDVQTGAVLYTPPVAGLLEDLMKAFCNFANDDLTFPFFLHPINRGIILHFLMGYIHPFPDGNGRTARAIFYWYLLKHGYWLIEYMSVSRIILHSKAQYARAYLHTEQDDNDLTYFIIYHLKSIDKALDEFRHYIRRKTAEKQTALALLRHTNFNERQIILLQELMQDPTLVFTVQQVQNKFGVSNQTARNDLNGLSEKGIFEERRNGYRMQFLPRPDFMKKIQGNE